MSVATDTAPHTKRPWSLVVGVIVGVILLTMAVRQVDWPAVVSALARVSPLWLLFAAAVTVLAQALFAARWFLLIGRNHGMSYGDAFDFLAIGVVAGLVLPPRLGDVARAIAAGRYHATSATNLFGTIVVERLADVLMLVLFGAAVSALMDVPPLLFGALLTLVAIVMAAAVVLWMGERGPLGVGVRWAGRWRGPDSRVSALLARFLAGTGVIRERSVIPKVLALTATGWIGAAVVASLTLVAFGAQAPWFGGAFVIVIINLAGILPAPPGGLGVYDYAAMVGASPWIADASAAFAFAVVSHALAMGVAILLGTWSLARKGLSLGGLRRLAQSETDQTGAP